MKAKVTLLTSLSLAIGQHRFLQNKPKVVEGADLITALKQDGSFAVEILPEEKKEEKQAAKPEAPKPSDEKPAQGAKPAQAPGHKPGGKPNKAQNSGAKEG